MIKEGMIIKTESMLLRVDKIKFGWVRFEFWDSYNREWKMRGYTEKKANVEEKIRTGKWLVQGEN